MYTLHLFCFVIYLFSIYIKSFMKKAEEMMAVRLWLNLISFIWLITAGFVTVVIGRL